MPLIFFLIKISTKKKMSEPDQEFDENLDDREVLEKFFSIIDSDKDGKLSLEEIVSTLQLYQSKSRQLDIDNMLKGVGTDLKKRATEDGSVDKKAFFDILGKIPRLRGQRIEWSKSLKLENLLACELPVGDLFDERSGIRNMNQYDIEESLQRFFVKVRREFEKAWSELNEDPETSTTDVNSVVNKFAGTVGKFGDTKMFEEGLDSQIGSADPFVLKGIIRDNVVMEGSKNKSITNNYKIVFSDFQEYARLLGHPDEYIRAKDSKLSDADLEKNPNIPLFLLEVAKQMHPGVLGPQEAELRDLDENFEDLKNAYSEILEIHGGVFPGEVGHVQKVIEFELEGNDTESAKRFHGELIQRAKKPTKFADPFLDAGNAPSSNRFKAAVYLPPTVVSPAQAKDQQLMLLLGPLDPSVKLLSQSSHVYIYCHLDADEKEDVGRTRSVTRDGREAESKLSLRELLEKLPFDLAKLREIFGPPFDIETGTKGQYIDSIVERATSKPTIEAAGQAQAIPIYLMQGRRRLGLRELMDVKDARDAKLRVEEVVQAYQYTGPCFQVIETCYE